MLVSVQADGVLGSVLDCNARGWAHRRSAAVTTASENLITITFLQEAAERDVSLVFYTAASLVVWAREVIADTQNSDTQNKYSRRPRLYRPRHTATCTTAAPSSQSSGLQQPEGTKS